MSTIQIATIIFQDLVPVTGKTSNTPIPPDATVRSLMTSDGVYGVKTVGIPQQILSSLYNIFCSPLDIILTSPIEGDEPPPDPIFEVVSVGFSPLVSYTAVWDPSQLLLTFLDTDGTTIGSATASSTESITKPLTGSIRLYLPYRDSSEGGVFEYNAPIEAHGFPVGPPWTSWGDWAVHGDILFPMTLTLPDAVIPRIPNHALVGNSSVLIDPSMGASHPDAGSQVIVFDTRSAVAGAVSVPFFITTQYTRAVGMSYLAPTIPRTT